MRSRFILLTFVTALLVAPAHGQTAKPPAKPAAIDAAAGRAVNDHDDDRRGDAASAPARGRHQGHGDRWHRPLEERRPRHPLGGLPRRGDPQHPAQRRRALRPEPRHPGHPPGQDLGQAPRRHLAPDLPGRADPRRLHLRRGRQHHQDRQQREPHPGAGRRPRSS